MVLPKFKSFIGVVILVVTTLTVIVQYISYKDNKEKLVSLLKVHSVYDEEGLIKLIRNGRAHDGGYVVPETAFEMADVLLGYGIADDISFEEQFSQVYTKPSFGFDCGVDNIISKSKLFTLVKECIGTDNYLYRGQKSSQKISSFSQQLNNLHLSDKKLFIKMDIEGAEYEAFEDIIKYSQNITGIVLEIHFSAFNINKAIKLLSDLQQDFLLVHLHGNNCIGEDRMFSAKNAVGNVPQILELTFINKSIVKDYQISENQTHPSNIDMPNCSHKKEAEFEILLDQ